jgi:hypothetical protein
VVSAIKSTLSSLSPTQFPPCESRANCMAPSQGANHRSNRKAPPCFAFVTQASTERPAQNGGRVRPVREYAQAAENARQEGRLLRILQLEAAHDRPPTIRHARELRPAGHQTIRRVAKVEDILRNANLPPKGGTTNASLVYSAASGGDERNHEGRVTGGSLRCDYRAAFGRCGNPGVISGRLHCRQFMLMKMRPLLLHAPGAKSTSTVRRRLPCCGVDRKTAPDAYKEQ